MGMFKSSVRLVVALFLILIGFMGMGALPAMADSWMQTDWSGGSGQAIWSDVTKYLLDDGHVDVTSSPGNVKIEGIPWYDANWGKRRPITINNSGGALSNYQIRIIATYDSDMQSDFDDIRFTDSDMTTELSYWCESYAANDSAIFWVKVPSIASGASTIYMYYGNTSASSASDGDATFAFFDDFEDGTLNKWTIKSGSWQIATEQAHSGNYSMKHTGVEEEDRWIVANSVDESDCLLEAYWRMSDTDFDISQFFRQQSGDVLNEYETNLEGNAGWDIAKMVDGSWSEIESNQGTPDANVWTKITTIIHGTNMKVLKNDAQITPSTGWTDVGTQFTSGTIGFRAWSISGTWWIDDVRLRKYVEPEPTTSVGSEEEGGWTEAYLISSVYDASAYSQTWGTMTWTDAGVQTIEFKVRTSNDSTMVDATDWSACDYVTKGQDISSINSVIDGHRYIQYRVELSTSSPSETPVLNDVTINYTTSVESWTQTDWSGGSGQDSWSDTTMYQSDDGHVDVTGSPGSVKLSELPSPISEPSFETVANWTYYENDNDYNGGRSSDWYTDGTYSYKFWSTKNISARRYCLISQPVDFTGIDTIYFDCKLWAEANYKFKAYVVVDATVVWQKSITTTATEYLNESIDVSAYTGNHYLRFVIGRIGIGTTNKDQTNYFDNIRTGPSQYNSSGILISSIYDADSSSKEWETMTWTDAGIQTIKFKVRTSNDSTMSSAFDWDSCDYVANGQDISTINSVADSHRYIQYRVELSTTNSSETPVLNDVTINYVRHPNIEVSPDSFNITLCYGDTKDTILIISNTGKGILTWSLSENPSVDWLNEDTTSGSIDSNSQYSITLHLDATSLSPGTYSDTLVITSNDPDEPTIKVPVKLTVQAADIVLSPSNFDFDVTICLGETKDTVIVISNVGDCVLNWSLLENPSVDWLSEDTTSGSVSPSDQDSVIVQFDATSLSPGTYSDTLVITSNDPDEPTIEIPIKLTVEAPDISLSPDNFNLTLHIDSTKDTTLVISNIGDCDLIWSLSENPAADWLSENPTSGTTNAGLQANVNVHFDATGLLQGTYNDTLVITSNDPDEPTIKVSVQLTVEAPDIALSDSSHNYGDVLVGDSLAWILKIYNEGTANLTVDSIKSTAAEFEITSPTFPNIILPSDSLSVTVTFIPSGAGALAGTLVVYSDDPVEPTVSVALSGNGLISTYVISGYVKYWADSTPVANVKMILTGGASDTTFTDSTGYYIFSGLQKDFNYTVIPSKTDTGKDTTITAYDASLVLNHVVELDTLDGNQRKAADVSGNNNVSPYDAALILRYVVDKITHFPAGDWTFTPDSITYTSLNSNQSNQNYKAILYGDTSGNGPGSKGGTLRTRLFQGGAFEKKAKSGGER